MSETFAEYQARLLALAEGADPFAVLRSTAARIAAHLAGRAAVDLQWSPQPGRWSIAQIVGHLADSEIVFGYRVRSILASPGTAIEAYDQDRWSDSQHAATSDAFASLSLFAALRIGNLGLLSRLTPGELDRYGIHAERGKESIALLLRLYAGHDRNHLAQIERLLAARPAAAPVEIAAVRPTVEPAVLEQIDVRAGTIRAAVPVAGADRLALLTVSFGDRDRTIVAGIRTERPSLEAIVGRQALFAINLQPRKIRGHVSEGMLFDIGFADGLRPAFAQPEWPVPDGVRAG